MIRVALRVAKFNIETGARTLVAVVQVLVCGARVNP